MSLVTRHVIDSEGLGMDSEGLGMHRLALRREILLVAVAGEGEADALTLQTTCKIVVQRGRDGLFATHVLVVVRLAKLMAPTTSEAFPNACGQLIQASGEPETYAHGVWRAKHRASLGGHAWMERIDALQQRCCGRSLPGPTAAEARFGLRACGEKAPIAGLCF